MSSSSWSLSCCSCARCSGDIEFIIACIAAIRRAICSSNSSSVCGFSGKKSPNSSMNCSNPGSSPRSRFSSISLRPAIMSFIRCMSCGGHVLHRPRHLLDHLLHQLLADLVEQLLEALRGLGRLEVVGLQLANLAGEVVGQHVEAEVAIGGAVACRLGASLVATALGCLGGVVDGVALLVDDVVQLVGDLAVDPAEVELVEPFLALLAQLVHQLAQALQTLAVAVAHALLHHPPQRRVDVAVVEQVVGQLVEQGVGVEIESPLRSVPSGVGESRCHERTLQKDRGRYPG